MALVKPRKQQKAHNIPCEHVCGLRSKFGSEYGEIFNARTLIELTGL